MTHDLTCKSLTSSHKMSPWAHFCKILLFLKYLINPESKGCLEKLKLPKFGKGCLKLSFFLCFTHWWNRLCETDWLGVGKDIKQILKFYKNELRFWFHWHSLIPRKCPRKPYFNTQWGSKKQNYSRRRLWRFPNLKDT